MVSGDGCIADKNGSAGTRKSRGGTLMQATVDYMIVYYLCGIMAALALIIAVGAIRHRSGPQSTGQDPSPDRKQ